MHLRFYTAGESHGQGLIGILEGMPANVEVDINAVNHELWRRQQGYGRGGRMRIEQDRAQIISGIRFGKTLGSPISVLIENKDWKNWRQRMAVEARNGEANPVHVPRPGHVDLAGSIKYAQDDIRNVLERASARETAMRVALGTLARQLLSHLGIGIASHVVQMLDVKSRISLIDYGKKGFPISLKDLNAKADESPVRCLDSEAEACMMALIDRAKREKDTVGGIFEVIAFDLPIGLGSHVSWDRRLDARIAAALMSIQAVKGVEIGDGYGGACRFGSQVHDQIYYDTAKGGYYRKQNRAGGLEAGITNGMPLVVRAAMKPLSTLMRPLDSVDIKTKAASPAHRERSDVCALPAASIVGEAMLALVLADAVLEKFGSDSMEELKDRYEKWVEECRIR